MGKYTILAHDGIGPGPMGPEAPAPDNQVDSFREAERWFRAWLRDTGNDYTRADGYGAPFADVVPTDLWDGISYGDNFLIRLERGPRGGVKRENF